MAINLPSSRKEVSDRMKTDVQNTLPNSNPFLKNSYLGALIQSVANRIFDFYIQQRVQLAQIFPDTATGAFLDRWGSYRNITRIGAATAQGLLTIAGADATIIPLGTQFQSDGNQYTSLAVETITIQAKTVTSLVFSAGIITATTDVAHELASDISVVMTLASEAAYNGTFDIIVTGQNTFTYLPTETPADPDGGTAIATATVAQVEVVSDEVGQDKNLGNGAKLTLTTPIAGANNDGFVQFTQVLGGTDVEDDASLRARILNNYRNPNTPFNEDNIIRVAKTVSGVTRVFVFRPDLTQSAHPITSLERVADNVIQADFSTPISFVGGEYIAISGATPVEFNTSATPVVVVDTTTVVYTVPVNPGTVLASGAITMEYSDLQPGQVRVLFTRDNDPTIIPNPAQITAVKNALLGIKPAHMADADLIVDPPIAKIVNFEFEYINPSTPSMRQAIIDNLSAFFRDETRVGTSIDANTYNAIIFNTIDPASGERLDAFTLASPSSTINVDFNEVPILGTVTFSNQ